MPAIRTKQLTRDFATVRAVDGLSLEVPEGIVFGFLGPNGAGKTTTIRLLLGLIEPTSGSLEVLGYSGSDSSDSIRANSGALLEHTGLYERLTALDNLDYIGRIWHIPDSARRDRIRELLTHFGLWDRRSEKVNSWSRGMKQKLAVARTLLHRPRLVFFDEPTAGLDPVAAASLREDIAGLVSRDGTTVFLTTHNLTEAEKLCSLVAVINKGKLLTMGHPDELRAKTGRQRVRVSGGGFTEGVIAAVRERPETAAVEQVNGALLIELNEHGGMTPLLRVMLDNGAHVDEVRRENATLEDAFLKLMEESDHVC